LHQFKNAMALGQTHPLAQHSGVTLSTVHTMKGQEFDIVFIIGMDDETFPDYRAVRSGGVELTQEKQFINISEQHILFIIGNGYFIFKVS
jgi:DNA helicase-2/ATP-dependent DNA helicase PcrA